MSNYLKVENLNFNYNKNVILKDISFECTDGITTLLGSNGAGKTTLMNIIVGLKNINSGNISLNGNKLDNVSLNHIGYLPQNFDIYPNVTGYDFLSYICDLKNIDKSKKKIIIDDVIDKLNLNSIIKLPFSKYSGGFKRRLGIAQAIIGDPKLIIIDEPTVGLDPEQRLEFRNYLSVISKNKITIISTHIIEDIELYSDKVLILDKGNLIFNGTIDDIITQASSNIKTTICKVSEFNKIKKSLDIIEEKRLSNDNIKIKFINSNIIDLNIDITSDMEVSLENAYIYIQKLNRKSKKSF